MKDKELIENSRLRERTGGYHKFVDSAEVHNPDPTSSHFISGKCPIAANLASDELRARTLRQGLRCR